MEHINIMITWFIHEMHSFISAGGWVVWVILATCILLISLIAEQMYFARFSIKERQKVLAESWGARPETHSWRAQKIRQQLRSHVHSELYRAQPYIKVLIMICPLLGLLGTVSGMIEVFDQLALTGTDNTRAMAAGISKATIPTMAGMMVAIMGLFLQSRLERLIQQCDQQWATRLALDPLPSPSIHAQQES